MSLKELIRKETDDKKRTILRHLLELKNDEPSKRLVFTIKGAAKACNVCSITYRKVLQELNDDGFIYFQTSHEGTTVEFI